MKKITLQNWLVIAMLAIGAVFTLFRFSYLSSVPQGFFVDEASIGLNAASILQTGTDEHDASMPLYFKAFGDYKNPTYIYSVVPLLAAFGNSVVGVRLASAIWGAAASAVFWLWLRKTGYSKTALIISSFILITSPWFVQISRVAFEVSSVPFFIFLAVVAFYQLTENAGLKKINFTLWLLVFTASLALSFYAYTAMRVIAPLAYAIGIALIWKRLTWRHIFISGLLFSTLLLPLYISQSVKNGALSARFAVVGIAPTMEQPLETVLTYGWNYLKHFSSAFLWQGGDGNLRHVPVPYGIVYLSSIPFLLLGMRALYKKRRTAFAQWILILVLISPIPSAVTVQSPHVLRSVSLICMLFIIIALGVNEALKYVKWKKLLVSILLFVLIAESIIFFHFYTTKYFTSSAIWFDASTVRVIKDSSEAQEPLYISNLLYPGTEATVRFFQSSKEKVNPKVRLISPPTISYRSPGTYILDRFSCNNAIAENNFFILSQNESACAVVVE